MKVYIFLILTFILATSCCKDESSKTQTDSNGVYTALPYHWKTSLHKNGVVSNSRFKAAVYYNNNILIPTTNGGNNREASLINTENGEYIWSWDDRYQPETEDISIKYPIQYNNLLTYQKGKRSYCINLDDGTTQWKYIREHSLDVRLFPDKNNSFFYLKDYDSNGNIDTQYATLCNINDGILTDENISANYSGDYTNPAGMIGGITNVIKLPNQEDLYAVTYFEPAPIWVVKSYLGLYNKSTNQWIYEHKLMAPPTLNTSAYEPKIYNNKLYAWVGKNIVCHDLETGEQLWIRSFPQDFLFSGFIIAEDKIIANNEDTFTYGLDPENGNTLWKTETSGTSGRMSYLNGIVYFVGGSSGKLHAIDVNTGEEVWRLDAEKLGEPSESIFKTNAVYVFPADSNHNARVIALSHLYAYCFDAYR